MMIEHKKWLRHQRIKDVVCPLCGSKEEKPLFKHISYSDYEIAYKHLYGDLINAKELLDTEYDMLQCAKCGLVFSNPMTPGKDEFYEKTTNHEGYYLSFRWEWEVVVEYIKKHNIKSILEIGCGSGCFLEYCKNNVNSIDLVGVDMTESACKEAKEKGVANIFCGTLEDFMAQNQDLTFDLVLSFHCLEHVASPKEFVESMLKVCNSKGMVINSFPYADSIIEPWFDCGNLPPHHMTRWNYKSCMNLGKVLTKKVELVAPKAECAYGYIKTTLVNTFFDFKEHESVTRQRLFIACVKHPYMVLKEIIRTLGRDKAYFSYTIGGEKKYRRAPYVVMTVIRKDI